MNDRIWRLDSGP